MKIILLIAIFFICPRVMAISTSLDSGFFAGGGLDYGQSSAHVDVNASTSNFQSQGYMLEAGAIMKMGDSSGLVASVEGGQNQTVNTLSSQTYLETGKLNYYAAKASLLFGNFMIGGGYRMNSLDTKSLDTAGSGYLESKYSGNTPFAAIGVLYDINRRFMFSAQAQYLTGTLSSSDSTLSNIKYSETAISLRFFIEF